MEEFVAIEDFPGYGVTTHGRVINTHRNTDMVLSPTEYGDLTVGLVKNGIQYRRSVKGLVARAFVHGQTKIFDTPMLKDGDRENLFADNIVWRPRWFVLMYTQQFNQPDASWWYAGPVVDVVHTVEYENILSAGIHTGSLLKDIRQSLLNQERVFPEGGIFKFV